MTGGGHPRGRPPQSSSNDRVQGEAGGFALLLVARRAAVAERARTSLRSLSPERPAGGDAARAT